MPNAFGMHADDAGSFSDTEDRVVPDPKTPSDYALHAIFLRFAASAESHIDEFLRLPMVSGLFIKKEFALIPLRTVNLISRTTSGPG